MNSKIFLKPYLDFRKNVIIPYTLLFELETFSLNFSVPFKR